MATDKQTETLLNAKVMQQDAARPEIVSRVHSTGKMTARERVHALLDEGSAVEYGSIAAQTEDGAWVPEAGGVDFVGTINSLPVIVSSTDYTDHGGGYGAGRLGRLFALAYEQRWPVVLFVDGGGSRARHPRAGLGHVEISGTIGRFSFLDGIPELSGWVPTVAIVSGPSFAGHASIAGFSDFLISTPGSSIGMGGPPMVEAALGKSMTANELAGAEMHELSGGIDLLVGDELAAIAATRAYLSYYQNNSAIPGSGHQEPDEENKTDLSSFLADQAPYDMHGIIEAVCDAGSMFELRPKFAPALITALARIGGHTVGVLANNPLVDDGAIDQNAATKITRFVEVCNTYEYPMLALIDTPGCIAHWQNKHSAAETVPGLTRWHARLARRTPAANRAVPLSVQIRRGRGLGAALMTGVSSTRGVPALRLAWPGVEIGRRDGYSAVVDHNAFDDVIAPNETRERLRRMLNLLASKPHPSSHRLAKKHPIDSW